MSTSVASYIRAQSRQYGRQLERIPESLWPPARPDMTPPIEVWRSRTYLVMVYLQDGYERLSVVRTELAISGRFAEGISWDDLQRLKAECGRGDVWAVEVFPSDGHVVNVQNMRHLFLLKEAPPYGWLKSEVTA